MSVIYSTGYHGISPTPFHNSTYGVTIVYDYTQKCLKQLSTTYLNNKFGGIIIKRPCWLITLEWKFGIISFTIPAPKINKYIDPILDLIDRGVGLTYGKIPV